MLLRAFIGLILLSGAPAWAGDAAYPSRTIRIIVGFPPAGAADIIARIVGQKLAEAWGQPVIIDNRPGAGSTIGSEIAAHSNSDGHTLLLVSASYATSAGLYQKLKYDPGKSFAPIIHITSAPNIGTVHPSVPAKSTQELIALAKASPGKLNVASSGVGSITHLTAELFSGMAGVNIVHVPFKGGGPALSALVAGQIQLAFQALVSSLGHVQAGRLRAIGVTSAKRAPVLPDVPTIAETIPGYEASNWSGLLAPAGISRAIVTRLNTQMHEILRSPDMVELMRQQGADAEGGTPEAFGKYVQSEITKWSKVIKATGLKPE